MCIYYEYIYVCVWVCVPVQKYMVYLYIYINVGYVLSLQYIVHISALHNSSNH